MDHSYNMGDHHGIYVGAAFSSMDEFQAALTHYMQKTNTVYNISKSQYMQNYHRTGMSRRGFMTKFAPLPPKLKYMYVLFGCKHYGVARSKSRGIRPNQKTFKTNCPSHISVMTDRKRAVLVVKTAVLEHNHHLGPDMARLYPENRRLLGARGAARILHVRNLPRDSKAFRETMLGSSRPPVMSKAPPSHKVLYEEDADEPADAPPSPQGVSLPEHDQDLENADISLEDHLESLQEEYSCSLDVYRPQGELKGVLVHDAGMRDTFAAFPEHLCVDMVGAILHTPVEVVLLTVEDAMGKSEVVGLGILLCQGDETVGWLLSAFRDKNPASAQTKTVYNNGSSAQGELLKAHFPDSRVLLNPAHVARAWKRDIAMGATGVTEDGEDLAHHLLKRALHATSTSIYDQVYAEMRSALPADILAYYDRRWHATRDQWTLETFLHRKFMASSTRLADHYKRKLGIRSGGGQSVPGFFRRLFTEIYQQRIDYNVSFVKCKIQPSSKSELSQYASLLTPFALSWVELQYELVDSCKPFDYIDNAGSSQGAISVPISSCGCPFFAAMALPCCHVFVRRRFLGLEMFDAGLYADRWTKEYCHRVASARSSAEMEAATLTSFQKMKRATELTADLATLLSRSSDECFAERMAVLEGVLKAWRSGEDVRLVGDGAEEARVVRQDGVYELMGVDVNRYVEVAEDNGMFVGDEVEVVIVQGQEET